MKTIQLNKGAITLPESWDELSPAQKRYAFFLLEKMIKGEITPPIFRLMMLRKISGYTGRGGGAIRLLRYACFFACRPFVAAWYAARLGKARFADYMQVWDDVNQPKRKDESLIAYNLFRLSEMVDFAFSLDGNSVVLNKKFERNPYPFLTVKGVAYTGRKFNHDIAVFTNITGKEYSDCFDLYVAHSESSDPVFKAKCACKILAILYPESDNYSENLTGDHTERMASVAPELRFAAVYWFSSIVEYYHVHPVYSLLFRKSDGASGDEKISLGMNETVLSLTNRNWSAANANLNDFFDMQIKLLKDHLSEALANGVKIADLAKKTKLSVNDINKLT